MKYLMIEIPRRLCYITFLLLFPSAVFSQQIPAKFYHLTVDNGLSHTDSKSITQDKLGFIWVATLFGLDKYDGYRIKHYYNDLHPKENASRNRLRDLFADSDGKIWLATESGIQCFNSRWGHYIDLKWQSFQKAQWGFTTIVKLRNNNLLTLSDHGASEFRSNQDSLKDVQLSVPPGTIFTSVAFDSDQNAWLTSEDAIWELINDKIVKKVAFPSNNASKFSKVYWDHQQRVFFVDRNKLYFTDLGLNQPIAHPISLDGLRTIELSHTIIRDIVEDQYNNYWVSTDDGLLFYNSRMELIEIINSKNIPGGLTTNHIEKLYIDRSQCLWICSYGGGVNYLDLNAKLFYSMQHNPDQQNSLSGNHIRAVIEGRTGKELWVGTNENGLNRYNYQTKLFTHYNTTSLPALKSNVVTCLVFDKDDNLWIGSDNGIEILSKDRHQLIYPPGYENLPRYQVESLAVDHYGQIWFSSSEKRMGIIRQKQGRLNVSYMKNALFIYPDPGKPEVYASSNHGLLHFYLNKDGSITRQYTYQANNTSGSLSSNYIYPIAKYTGSTLCVGTIGGGLDLVDVKDGHYKATTYATAHHVFKDVESIQIDDHHNIWMGGNGLEKFDPKTKTLVRFDKNDGLQGNSFKIGASCKGKGGRLYFGGIDGLNYFYPDSLKTNRIPANPVLTDLLIYSDTLSSRQNNGTGFSKTAICYSKNIKLNYLQNNFRIIFSAMHFANPLKCKYRYKLTGFDNSWRYTDGENPGVSYSNLDYGSYDFVMQATNNDGLWSVTEAGISIAITPPWWKSDVAKALYWILFISGLAGIYIYQARWYRLKRTMAIREVEEQKRDELHTQQEELYQQQIQFFTNISHEFRTPLTLILGPLENMLKENPNVTQQHGFELMLRNAKRLTNLINELMNFSKVADGVIGLQVQPVVLADFTQQLHDEFSDLAIRKNIEFTVLKPAGSGLIMLDVEVVEKILFNLLNNAFKYTGEGGHVMLEVLDNIVKYRPAFSHGFELPNTYRAASYVYFRVADTGVGISEDSISKIFERYYRVGGSHLGSGVGLALVKSLTQLHKGDISVYSERSKGTEVIIALPCRGEDYNEPSANQPSGGRIEKLEISLSDQNINIDNSTRTAKGANARTEHILLVEDNEELRTFLKDLLQEIYHIYEAANGRQGLEIAIDKTPDLVISDVMMPEMDGLELCLELKQNFETSHIPFIILSAKDALKTKLEGLEFGADYYFAKPLSPQQLLLTVRNLFEQKEKLKARYTKDYYASAAELVHSTVDKDFLTKLISLIEKNIEKKDLDVEFISSEMFVSRTKLYQKIQSITGQSVAEFIRTIRLKRAAYIMTHEQIPLNELTERIGLQSNSNFSKIFKKEFGVLPSQFLEQVNKR